MTALMEIQETIGFDDISGHYINELHIDYALYNAVSEGNFEKVKQYIRLGVSSEGIEDALPIAVRKGHLQITEYLLDNGGYINIGPYGNTLPIEAVRNGDLKMLKMLVKRDALIYGVLDYALSHSFGYLKADKTYASSLGGSDRKDIINYLKNIKH